MKGFLFAFALFFSMTGFAQSSKFDVLTDEQNGSVVYKGAITFGDLAKEPSFTWLVSRAETYAPHNDAAVQLLRERLDDYDIVVLMGTWCEDSQILVPQLYKLLQMVDYPMSQYRMYGVDRAKTSKNDEHTTYRVEKVPTIILRRNGKEAGRITETVSESLEADLSNLLMADK